MAKSKIIYFLLLASVVGCGQPYNPGPPANTGLYWNVVLAGNSTAAITFSQPLASTGIGVVSGGSTGTYSTSFYNLYVSGGGSTCQMVNTGGTAVVGPGSVTGNIKFNGTCINQMTTNLVITLGNSISGILDLNSNFIVSPGKTVSAQIVAPGATGASSGNITY